MTEQELEKQKQTIDDEQIEEKDQSQEADTSQSDVPLENDNEKRSDRRTRKERLRIFPIWLRILVSIVLIGGSLLLGIIFGYGVIGDGNPTDALSLETWYHIIDIIQGEEHPE